MSILAFTDHRYNKELFTIVHLAEPSTLHYLIEYVRDRDWFFFAKHYSTQEVDIQVVSPNYEKIREVHVFDAPLKMSEFLNEKLEVLLKNISGEFIVFLTFIHPNNFLHPTEIIKCEESPLNKENKAWRRKNLIQNFCTDCFVKYKKIIQQRRLAKVTDKILYSIY